MAKRSAGVKKRLGRACVTRSSSLKAILITNTGEAHTVRTNGNGEETDLNTVKALQSAYLSIVSRVQKRGYELPSDIALLPSGWFSLLSTGSLSDYPFQRQKDTTDCCTATIKVSIRSGAAGLARVRERDGTI